MRNHLKIWSLFLIFYLTVKSEGVSDDQYKIGVGIADITGPAAEINMALILI